MLGNIVIDGDSMIAEVNSQARAKKFETLVKKYLGNGASFEKIMVESVEDKMNAAEKLPKNKLDKENE